MKQKEMKALHEQTIYYKVNNNIYHRNGRLTSTGKYPKKVTEMLQDKPNNVFYNDKGIIMGLVFPLSKETINNAVVVMSGIEWVSSINIAQQSTVKITDKIELVLNIQDKASAVTEEFSLGVLEPENLGLDINIREDVSNYFLQHSVTDPHGESVTFALSAFPDYIIDNIKKVEAPLSIGNFKISSKIAELIDNPALKTIKPEDFIYNDNPQSPVVEEVLTHLLSNGQVRLVGPPSTGKNVLAEDIGKILGLNVVNVACTNDIDATDFFYTTELINGDTVHVPSELVNAFTHGGVVVVDEFNVAPADVLIALHSLLDDRRIIENKKLNGGKKIPRHPQCYFIFTMNDNTAGTKVLNTALESRMATIYIKRSESINAILNKEIVIGSTTVMPEPRDVKMFSNLYKLISNKMEEGQFTEAHVSIRVYKAALKALTMNPKLGFKKAAKIIAYASTENVYAIEDAQTLIEEINDNAVISNSKKKSNSKETEIPF